MAQTSISGRIFENDLRKMIATLVWHNKYLGDKHDSEDKYVDAVEVDTYLTGARHLLMTYSRTDLEKIENMNESEYMSFRARELTKAEKNAQTPYWDMFYYGKRTSVNNDRSLSEINYDIDQTTGLYIIDNRTVERFRQYEEKNTYYRELYGLPEYTGTIIHCNRCLYEFDSDKSIAATRCPKCDQDWTNLDFNHTRPSEYSWISQFPIYTDRRWHEDWVPDGTTETNINGEEIPVYYNPKYFLYAQPLKNRLYAEYSCTFLKEKMELTKGNRHYAYLKHMTYSKIHPFVARLSDRFEILYLQDADIDFLTKDFRDTYEECRLFMKYRYYTEAYRNQYSEYEGFVGLAILFMALQRMQAKYLEADITRDFYDLESIEVVYNAYSVPFYDEIPVTYHNKIIKAINILISKKGSNECFKDIFAIFGYSTLNMYQYYILKTQKMATDGKPQFAVDENGNEIPEEMYDVKMVKADIGENPYSYIIDSLNYMNYYGVTEPDTYWLNDDDLLYQLYHSEYNFLETKYIGIEMVFSLTRFTIETEYIMRMLLDNRNSGGNGTNQLTVYHGKLGIDIDLYSLVIYIMYIIGKEFGLKDGGSLQPLTDPIKLSSIYGFNFIEDLSMVFGYLSRKFVYNYKAGHMQNSNDHLYFKPTSFSYITDYNNVDADTQALMDSEAELNGLDVDHDGYNKFTAYVKPYMDIGFISRATNVQNALVYSFNVFQNEMLYYTQQESKMNNLLDAKFVKVYYSDNVCAYCGIKREDLYNMYPYCHNTQCYSNHNYADGYGPLLKDVRGRIPMYQAVDTSKDTPIKLYRNHVYAEFVSKYDLINSYIIQIMQIFNTYPIDLVDTSEYITYNLDKTGEDTDIILIANDIDRIKDGGYVTLERYNYGTLVESINARVVCVLNTTINEVIGDEVITYHQIVINRKVSYKANDKFIVNYRKAKITYDDWCQMMYYGFMAKVDYMNAKKVYEDALIIIEGDPSAYTEEELEAMREEMLRHQEDYTHSLYYLLGVLSEFVNSDADDRSALDLGSMMWAGNTSIKDILVRNDMYYGLVGLRGKREFRLYVSNQIDELSDLIISSYDSAVIDRVRWIRLYLNYYFLDRNKTQSVLVDTIDDFFLFDKSMYNAQYSFGQSTDTSEVTRGTRSGVSYTYMNDYMSNITDEITGKPVNVFDYISDHIRDILDADDHINKNDYEMEIGIGRSVDKDWSKLQSSYNAIAELHREFTTLTWGIKNPKAYYAVRRLNKMLMTTCYANEIYGIYDNKGEYIKTASSYKELLDDFNPSLSIRIDNMTEKQRIIELEYSLSCLDKISDDLIYLHAYGGFNMKKILSYIWKLIYFFKSAKVDLLNYAIEFRVDDKTDNLMKYMTELVKLDTSSKVTPDHWKLTDIVAMHEITTRLNIDKSIRFTFSDVIYHTGRFSTLFSANYLADGISGHQVTQVNSSELNYTIYDFMKHDTTISYIGRSGEWNIPDISEYESPSNDDKAIIANIRQKINAGYMKYPYITEEQALSIDKSGFNDINQLGQRIVCELDFSRVTGWDSLGNPIYDYKLDDQGNRIYHVFTSDDEYYEWVNTNNRWNYYNLRRGNYASVN